MVMECKVTARKSHYPKDVPFEVPEGWVWCKITDVVDKLTDGTHNSPKSYPSGDFMYVTAKNIKINGIDLSNISYVTEEVHNEIYNRCNPEKGDILFIKDGATCGVSTINNLDVEFSLLSSVALIKPNKNIINAYLNLFLQSEFCYRNVRDSMKGVGITRIILKQMELWDIPLPPYEEQKRIVSLAELLLLATEGIEKEQAELEKIIKQTKELVLDLATHGKLVTQDPAEEPAIALLRRINPAFVPAHNLQYEDGIKKGWIKCRVSEAFEINPKVVGLDDEECAFVPMALVPGGYSNDLRFEKKQWSVIKNGFTHFADGDIGVAKISPCLENRKSVIFRGLPSGKGAGTTELIILRPVLVTAGYGLLFLKSRDFIAKCKGTYNGVVGQQRVDMSVIRGMYINIPPISEQHRIVQAVNSLFHHLDIIQRSNEL